jgi:phage baseplate assembly protein gpV
MKQLLLLERRLQDIERALQNMERNGEIVDVKFDKEKKRWYVKINDGDDKKPSGTQQAQSSGNKPGTFKSDWLPWNSFSHDTIKMSIPPKKGMKATMRSPCGMPELAVATPFHYGPETPSPHDKEDEIVKLVESPSKKEEGQEGGSESSDDKFEHWTHETNNSKHLIIKKKSGDGDSKERKLPEVNEDGDEDLVQVKSDKDGHLITVGKSKAKIKVTKDSIEHYLGTQASMVLKADGLQIKMGGVTWDLTQQGWKQTSGIVRHDEKDIGKTHKHLGVVPGGGETDVPKNIS